MRQAQTLNEAQFRRVLHYCRSRRHPVRDTTIFMVSFYAGLRAKEIASLKLSDVFDETGAVREQFILGVDQSKGGQRRTVYLNQRLRKALAKYAKSKCLSVKWSCKIGQSVKVYSNVMKEFRSDETTEVFRPV